MPSRRTNADSRNSSEDTVRRLIGAATQLLSDKGPYEIKTRAVAEIAQVSTTAVYYHLGGLPGLLQAVVDRAFRELDQHFSTAVSIGDPVAELFSMALAARRLAKANPHLYDLMFGLSARGNYRAPEATSAQGGSRTGAFADAYAHLVQACARLHAQAPMCEGAEPELVASQLWSCVHGFITLELGGQFTNLHDPVREILVPMTTGVLVAAGEEPSRVAASYRVALADDGAPTEGSFGSSRPRPPEAAPPSRRAGSAAGDRSVSLTCGQALETALAITTASPRNC